jgi:hypothetical protein
MDNFRETAFSLTAWYAFLAFLGALLLIVLNDIETPAAFLIAANVALLFALGLIAKARGLSERSITRGEFWRALPARERPRGETGWRMAHSALEQTWLKFAKGAAAVAIVLCGLAYASHGTNAAAWAQALRMPAQHYAE